MAVVYPSYHLDIEYPESDGQPVAETSLHLDTMIYLLEALRDLFRSVNDLYVASNMMMYYQEGNPHVSVAPDVFVVKGIDKRERRTYKIWEEGKGPTVVFEITSRSTKDQDLGAKRGLYESLGVQEYFIYDPMHEYLTPPLQGFELIGAHYGRLTPTADGKLHSRMLNVDLQIVDDQLRVLDPTNGEPLKSPLEGFEAAREQATARAAAEAEAARLRAELEELRRKQG